MSTYTTRVSSTYEHHVFLPKKTRAEVKNITDVIHNYPDPGLLKKITFLFVLAPISHHGRRGIPEEPAKASLRLPQEGAPCSVSP